MALLAIFVNIRAKYLRGFFVVRVDGEGGLRGVFFNGQRGRLRPILEMAEIFFGESSGPKTT